MNNLVKKPLSNFDLNDLLKDINKELGERKTINIMTVPQILHNPQQFKKMVKKDGYVIIFLENEGSNIGHWVVTFWSNNTLNFFDSYGQSPEVYSPALNDFFIDNFKKVRYNILQYQKYGSGIATCGRYAMFVVGLRKALGNKMTIEDIKQVLFWYKKRNPKKSFDQIVASLVNFDI